MRALMDFWKILIIVRFLNRCFKKLTITARKDYFIESLLVRMCWAPANLRYGRKISNNNIVGNSLDPMGDQSGKITTQEKWLRNAFKYMKITLK